MTGPETLIHRAISSLAIGMIGPDTPCLELSAIIPLSLHNSQIINFMTHLTYRYTKQPISNVLLRNNPSAAH